MYNFWCQKWTDIRLAVLGEPSLNKDSFLVNFLTWKPWNKKNVLFLMQWFPQQTILKSKSAGFYLPPLISFAHISYFVNCDAPFHNLLSSYFEKVFYSAKDSLTLHKRGLYGTQFSKGNFNSGLPNFLGSQWCIIDHHDGVHNANLQITFSEIQILQNVNL